MKDYNALNGKVIQKKDKEGALLEKRTGQIRRIPEPGRDRFKNQIFNGRSQ